jgi:hypothetical protein
MTVRLLPMMVPHFTALQRRGLKRSLVAVYGAVVAYDALQYVPTVEEIANAAGLGVGHEARRTRRALGDLARMGLLERVPYRHDFVRYLVRGPRLAEPPANDNAQAVREMA